MFEELNSNSKRTVREGVDLSELSFVKLKECVGETLKVDGFFFTEGDFGTQVVVVANGKKINMPARAVAQFEKIREDDEMLQAVLDGKLEIVDIAPFNPPKGMATTTYTLRG